MEIIFHKRGCNIIAVPSPTKYTNFDKYMVQTQNRGWSEICPKCGFRVFCDILQWQHKDYRVPVNKSIQPEGPLCTQAQCIQLLGSLTGVQTYVRIIYNIYVYISEYGNGR